jgi:hypothetical protein
MTEITTKTDAAEKETATVLNYSAIAVTCSCKVLITFPAGEFKD